MNFTLIVVLSLKFRDLTLPLHSQCGNYGKMSPFICKNFVKSTYSNSSSILNHVVRFSPSVQDILQNFREIRIFQKNWVLPL